MFVNICQVFGRGSNLTTAVEGLTLNCYEGQITVLVGPNGAGKTAIVHMLTGTVLDELSVLFCGPTSRLPPVLRPTSHLFVGPTSHKCLEPTSHKSLGPTSHNCLEPGSTSYKCLGPTFLPPWLPLGLPCHLLQFSRNVMLLSHSCKLTDLTIKINSFDDFSKRTQSNIKPTARTT